MIRLQPEAWPRRSAIQSGARKTAPSASAGPVLHCLPFGTVIKLPTMSTAAGPISQLTLVPGLTTGTATVTANRAMPDQNRLRGVSHARTLSSLLPIFALLICGWRSITLPWLVIHRSAESGERIMGSRFNAADKFCHAFSMTSLSKDRR